MRALPAGLAWAVLRIVRATALRAFSSVMLTSCRFEVGASSCLRANAASRPALSIATGPATEPHIGRPPSKTSGWFSTSPAVT
jgi:hypothetical protein